MSYENISAELSEEEFNQLVQKLKEIEAPLSFAVNLTADDIKSLYLLGDKSLAFVEAAFRYARERQNLFPGYLEFDEFKKDLNLYNQLKQVQEFLKPLTEKVVDTTRAVGSEAFLAARTFYKAVQDASANSVACSGLRCHCQGSGQTVCLCPASGKARRGNRRIMNRCELK